VHKINLAVHNNNKRYTFKIEERRRKAASLLAQSMTESEIAQALKVDQSTIS
jgi:transposase